MMEFVELTAKTHAYLRDDNPGKWKEKETKKCVIERRLMFENYIDCLLNNEMILKLQQRFKSDHHNVYTKQINKIALRSNDNKRSQTFNKITTYPYGTNAFKVCKSEMLNEIQMINFDNYANENKAEYNLKWPYIPQGSHRTIKLKFQDFPGQFS